MHLRSCSLQNLNNELNLTLQADCGRCWGTVWRQSAGKRASAAEGCTAACCRPADRQAAATAHAEQAEAGACQGDAGPPQHMFVCLLGSLHCQLILVQALVKVMLHLLYTYICLCICFPQ